ncbi:MAG: Rid family hydrolase [Bacteroidota bacterium]
MKTNRRSLIKKISLAVTGLLGVSAAQAGVSAANATTTSTASNEKILAGDIVYDQETPVIPLFSTAIVHNGLVYIAGKGAHFKGNITEHTKKVLDDLQAELEKAGSSMEHVLKVV